MKGKSFILALLTSLLLACEGERQGFDFYCQCADTLELRHAVNLTFYEGADGSALAMLRDPWDTTRLRHSYLLLPEGATLSDLHRRCERAGATIVRTPLQRAAVYTALHAALLIEMGCLERIGGVCDAAYIASPEIHERLERGEINDYGYGLNPNLELIMDTQPDALMPSPFQNAGYGGVEKLGLPIVECADYMEATPLGQAEWMRFYGRLFGVGDKADSLFAAVEEKYERLRKSVRDSIASLPSGQRRPSVFCDLLTGATWFVPASHSTTAQLIADAGGEYVFGELPGAGSVAMTVESVLAACDGADLWLMKYNAPAGDHTYRSLAAENVAYAQFRAYRERRVYGCNTALVPFFEEARFHPDRVLENLICVIRGDGADGRYYKKVRE